MISNVVQRWSDRRAKFKLADTFIKPADFDVSEISDNLAKDFVLNHHYAASYPAARRRFGLFEHGDLVGVAVFSHPCNEKTITTVFRCQRAVDGLELGRFVLLDGVAANGESWFLARCREKLKNDYPGITSFSDPIPRQTVEGQQIFAGHIGIIYQASNAAYLGRGTARTLRLLPDGKVMSARAIQKIRKAESGWQYAVDILRSYGANTCPLAEFERRAWLNHWLDILTRTMRHKGNLKYAWSFSRIKLDSLPYPKFSNQGVKV
jgi:hypothetical protein